MYTLIRLLVFQRMLCVGLYPAGLTCIKIYQFQKMDAEGYAARLSA